MAKHSKLHGSVEERRGKPQEIWDVGQKTKQQIQRLKFSKERFLAPATDSDDLIAEGLMNRVFRICEEAGRIDDKIALRYGVERQAANGVRNRLAHAYGEVDRSIIWEVIEHDIDALLNACRAYCDDEGVDLP